MALVTKQDYIYQALRKCGQMRPGYVPSPELLADASNEWQSLFDSWAAERTMGFSIPTHEFNVTGPGSQTGGNGYSIGPSGADWTAPRPNSIVRANCVMTNLSTQPVYLALRPVSAEEWASLAIQQIPGIDVTSIFYYDPQFPNGVFNVFPPLTGNAIQIYTWAALAVPAALNTPYSAPPGYMDAVIWSLAERLWPLCTKQMMANRISQMYVNGKAYEACQKVRTVNRPIPALSSDFHGANDHAGPYYDSFVSYTGEPY